MSRTGFSATETRAVVSIAGLYMVRMLGLFMLLPVLALYARDLPGATPLLIGLALGIYGLSQACLQLPLGMLSDRIGRKPVILGGLAVFFLGSIVAALADTMHGIVAGRLLQGAGAIASTLMALLADVTREHNRSKAMAAVGAGIGVSFALSLVLGPLIAGAGGLAALFGATAILALGGIVLVLTLVPSPVGERGTVQGPRRARLARVLGDAQLLRLNAGVFVLHFVMTASFVAVPLLLADDLRIPREIHGRVYAGVMVGAFLAMIPCLVLAERRRRVRPVFAAAVALLGLAMAGLPSARDSLVAAVALLWLYFLAFNYLEATLPSLMTRATRRDNRGTASGVYSTFQFLGAFLGGGAGGWTLQHAGPEGVFWLCAGLAAAWLALAIGMQGPRYLRSITVAMDAGAGPIEELSLALQRLPGVREVLIVAGDSIAYLQVDGHFDDDDLSGLPVRLV